MSKAYYVVTFPQQNPQARHGDFVRWGAELRLRSASEPPRKVGESDHDFEYALVLSLPSIPAAVKDMLPPSQRDRLADGGFPYRTKEYEGYEKVYFLNEAALKMYREGDIVFDVLKRISEDEIPQGCDMVMLWPH